MVFTLPGTEDLGIAGNGTAGWNLASAGLPLSAVAVFGVELFGLFIPHGLFLAAQAALAYQGIDHRCREQEWADANDE